MKDWGVTEAKQKVIRQAVEEDCKYIEPKFAGMRSPPVTFNNKMLSGLNDHFTFPGRPISGQDREHGQFF